MLPNFNSSKIWHSKGIFDVIKFKYSIIVNSGSLPSCGSVRVNGLDLS